MSYNFCFSMSNSDSEYADCCEGVCDYFTEIESQNSNRLECSANDETDDLVAAVLNPELQTGPEVSEESPPIINDEINRREREDLLSVDERQVCVLYMIVTVSQ